MIFVCFLGILVLENASTAFGLKPLLAIKDGGGTRIWTDEGSGANDDFSTWTTNYSPNFYVLFHHGQSNYGPLSDPIISVMSYGDSAALARPDNFEWVWDDRGSGADDDVTIFRTICPSGYVSLGDVTVAAYGDPPAALYDRIRCLKSDYAYPCHWGARDYWDDSGSGADEDVRVFSVICNAWINDQLTLDKAFSAGNFYVCPMHIGCLPSTTPYGLRHDLVEFF